MNFAITSHAVDRYIARIAPGLDYASARAELQQALPHAVRLKDKSTQGHFLWKVESPRMRLVTKRDNHLDIVVTVLYPEENHLPSDIDHLQELLREREEHAARQRQEHET